MFESRLPGLIVLQFDDFWYFAVYTIHGWFCFKS